MSSRPKPENKITNTDIVIEVITGMILIAHIAMLIYVWSSLPGTIPIHFGAGGEVNGYGSKTTLFLFLPVILVLYILLSVLTKFPHIYNYIVDITEENAQVQYRLARTFMRVLKLEIAALFTVIDFAIVSAAKSGSFKLGLVFLPVVLIIVFGSIGYYVYRSVKAK